MADNVVTVKRGGSYLTVPALAVERYLAKGYDVVDDNDNTLESSVPNDVNALKIAYEKHIAKIKDLESQISTLKAQLKESQSTKKVVEVPKKEIVLEEVELEKPKTARKSKK